MRRKLTAKTLETVANTGPKQLECFDTVLSGFGARIGDVRSGRLVAHMGLAFAQPCFFIWDGYRIQVLRCSSRVVHPFSQ